MIDHKPGEYTVYKIDEQEPGLPAFPITRLVIDVESKDVNWKEISKVKALWGHPVQDWVIDSERSYGDTSEVELVRVG